MTDKKDISLYQLMWRRRRGFLIYVAASFLPILQQLLQEVLFSFSFTLAEARTGTELSGRISLLVGGMLSLSAFFWLSRRLRIGFMRDILLDIRVLSFQKIMTLPVRLFARQTRDQHLSRLVNDINIIENDFFLSFLNVIFNAGLTLASLVILGFIDWRYALLSALATLTVALVGHFFKKGIVSLKQKESQANQAFSQEMSNVYQGLEILKLNGVEESFRVKSMGYVRALEGVKMRFNLLDQFQSGLMESLGLIFTLLSFFYVGWRLAAGEISLAAGIFITQITQRAIWSMVQIFPHLNKLRASQSLFAKLVKGPVEGDLDLLETGKDPFSFKEDLVVQDLTFTYPDKEVLQKTNFRLKAGSKTLLKGPSGSGKTTLLNLLAGVYTDYQGQILYDGRELSRLDILQVNRGLAEIYQDVFLFEDSLANNITLYADYSQADMDRAIQQAGLNDLLDRLPLGLDTPIQENGKNLSGGERQRIAIARAVIKGASLLLADEATSNLDEALGRHVEETLLGLEATVIAISHRSYPGLTENYDQVLEIESGQVSRWQAKDYFQEVI
ncbi:MAG TPA: ABC transporter ATP-binding protein [Clostridia bacterium]|nr:ABC transporter ATP-binding protein [Clostridia bacterium]